MDGRQYNSIGTVKAAGNSNVNVSYTFTGRHPGAVNYYRLKMVDADARLSYSTILLLSLGSGRGAGIFVTPNPVKSQLQISWRNMPPGYYQVEIVSAIGQVLKIYRTTVSGANQTMVITRQSNWKRGIAFVNITSTGDSRQASQIILE